VAFEGTYVPTVGESGMVVRSAYPEERNPAIVLSAYRGNLGLDSGIPSSVYSLNQNQIAKGALQRAGEPKILKRGEIWTLDDGTKLELLGTRPFITVAIRYDPTQPLVLAGAVLGLIGLMLSLGGHRRRVWFRVSPLAASGPPTGGSVVAAGGLPRTDYPGFADEFTKLVAATRDSTSEDPERTA
jgi:cytochrome c biogenesis protein